MVWVVSGLILVLTSPIPQPLELALTRRLFSPHATIEPRTAQWITLRHLPTITTRLLNYPFCAMASLLFFFLGLFNELLSMYRNVDFVIVSFASRVLQLI